MRVSDPGALSPIGGKQPKRKYRYKVYQRTLLKINPTAHTRDGKIPGNAVRENYFALLKRELLYPETCQSGEQFEQKFVA